MAPPSDKEQLASTAQPASFVAVARRSHWPLWIIPALVVLLGAACALLVPYLRRQPAVSTDPALQQPPAATPPVKLPSPPVAPSHAAPEITLSQSVRAVEHTAKTPVVCALGELNILDHWRITRYEGDWPLGDDDLLSLLCYADLRVRREPDRLAIAPPDTAQRLWEFLTAPAGPEGPAWGALRHWRSFHVADEREFAAIIAAVRDAPTAASIHSLGWRIAGPTRAVQMGDDGRITVDAGKPLAQADRAAATEILLRAATSGDAAIRVAAAAALGQILAHSSQPALPADAPVLKALQTLLQDQDAEVARSAAWALGGTPSVAAVVLETGCLTAWRDRPLDAAVALAALVRSEALGRSLPAEALGPGNAERRITLYQTVAAWLAALAREQPAAAIEPALAAAWLRAVEVFRVEDCEAYLAALQERLWKTNDLPAQLAVLATERTVRFGAAPGLPAALQLATVAGPSWSRYRFSSEQALDMLRAGDQRLSHAALWRLARVLPRGTAPEAVPAPATVRQLATTVESVARNGASAILRRLALEGAYQESPRRDANGAVAPWRLRSDAALAMQAFLEDASPAVQSAAAGIFGRVAEAGDLVNLAQGNLATREPGAVARLLTSLGRRWRNAPRDREDLGPAIVALAERFIALGDPRTAVPAAALRVSDPALDPEDCVRLARSFRTPAMRVAAVRALATRQPRLVLDEKLAAYLLADPAPDVRAAAAPLIPPKKDPPPPQP